MIHIKLHKQHFKKILIFTLVLAVCLAFAPLRNVAMAIGGESEDELAALLDQIDEEQAEPEQNAPDLPDGGEPEPPAEEIPEEEIPDEEIPEEELPDEEIPDEEIHGEEIPDEATSDEKIPDEAPPEEPEAEIMAGLFAISEDTAIVSDVASLKTALTSATITTVHLDADITLPSGGIVLNNAKPFLIIDGTNPYGGNPQAIRTMTEHNSYALSDTIELRTNGTLKSIKLQNIHVIGKNYFGTVGVHDAATNVTLTFENFTYEGPQPAFNRNGTVHIINSTITRGYGYLDCFGEVAEAANVILEGDVYLDDTKTGVHGYSTFWMHFAPSVGEGSINILPNARVTCLVAGRSQHFSYVDGAAALSGVKLIIGEGAVFEYRGIDRFWGSSPLKGLAIENNAQMIVNLSESYLLNAMIQINGDVKVGNNAVFHMISPVNTDNTVLLLNGGSATFNNPKSVVLSKPKGRLLDYALSGRLDINAQQINYWKEAGNGDEQDMPLYSWRKADGGNVTFGATVASNGNLSGVTSNYASPADYTELAQQNGALTASTFHLGNARTLAFGSVPLTAEYRYTSEDNRIWGETDPGATVRVLKKAPGDSAYSDMDSVVTSDGFFDFVSAQNLKDASIKVRSYVPYLAAQKDLLVSAPILTVMFQTARGDPPPDQYIEWGGLAERPQDPVDPASEMDFGGWYRDEALAIPWDFDANTVTDHLTLYAKWTLIPYNTVKIEHIRIRTDERLVPEETHVYRAGSTVAINATAPDGYKVMYYIIGQDLTQYANGSSFVVNGDMAIKFYYMSTVIEMEVPMQMLFAAFESNGGDISSPDYKIINHSDMAVDVRLQELRSDEQTLEDMDLRLVSEAVADGDLQLDLMGKSGFSQSLAGILPNIDLAGLGYLGTLGGYNQSSRQGEIAIGGRYAGPFQADYKQPRVSFVFQFQLAT